MDDGGPTASILLFFVLLILDIVIFGFSAALQNLNLKEEERRFIEEHDRKSYRLCRLVRNADQYVNMVQAVITAVSLLAGSCIASSFKGYAFFLSLFAVLYILLVFGVLVPKGLAAKSPQKWARRLVDFIWLLRICLMPLTGLIGLTGKLVLLAFGVRSDADRADVTEDEIISMVNEGHEQGVIQASEAEMITNIFEYSDKEATNIMTNRRDIVGIDCRMSFGEAVQFMLNENYSRYPVYRENIDHIIGVLHMKDALRRQSQTDWSKPLEEIPDLLREVRFIPETRKIDALFKTMQSTKLQMVIVVDEYGQTSGLIAMEDILEEIVGNILDEYDDEEICIQEKGQDEYVIEGKTRLDDLEERFNIRFEEEQFETINGFLIARLEHIPAPDEKFDTTVDGYNFRILAVENKMISQVLVTKLPDADFSEEETEDNAEAKNTINE